jgi:hypothetical protein
MNNTVLAQGTFGVFTAKVAHTMSSRHHAQQEHRIKRHDDMVDAVQLFLLHAVNIQVWDAAKPEKAIAEVMTSKRDFCKRLGIDDRTLPFVACLNWTAPCLVHTAIQDAQVNIKKIKLFTSTYIPTMSYI